MDVCLRRSLACMLAAFAAAAPALAQSDGSAPDSTSFSVRPGSLSSTPARMVRVARHGRRRSRPPVYRVTVRVVDATGSGKGWHLTMTGLRRARASVLRASVRGLYGSLDPRKRKLHYPIRLNRKRRTVLSIARNRGMGTFAVTFTVAVRGRIARGADHPPRIRVASGPR
jgi:hypothetical protein